MAYHGHAFLAPSQQAVVTSEDRIRKSFAQALDSLFLLLRALAGLKFEILQRQQIIH
jgi:hypothetical protein